MRPPQPARAAGPGEQGARVLLLLEFGNDALRRLRHLQLPGPRAVDLGATREERRL